MRRTWSGLLEVDLTGFVPVASHLQTTSIYFHRACDLQPLTGRQPVPRAGHAPKNWEASLLPVAGGLMECDGERFRGIVDDLTFTVTSGIAPRRFRALSYVGFDDTRPIAILDLDRRRVLLTRHRPASQARGETVAEVERIAGMDWTALSTFIAQHECRRYRLEERHLQPESATTGR